MDVVWNFEGVRIYGVIEVVTPMTPKIRGIVEFGGDLVPRLNFIWTAEAMERGYRVWIRDPRTGRETMYEGPTYNLLLEVNAAMRRH